MCGIVGFSDRNIDKGNIIKSMADKLIHRGPDDVGYYVDDNIALGHRRLSIIDLNTGKQPIEDDKYVIIFNGEIYNYLELKDELKSKYKFKTKSDTEVLLKGFE
ncbi:MAG: asparagine synthetase B, partial [Bacilli bacterium]|nr:asparagine synthetase B [Bacilli bacterium]